MDILNDDILLNEKDLLITIWTKPKLSLEYILKSCPNKYVTILLILSGITNALDRNNWYLASRSSISTVFLIIILIIGGLSGLLLGKIYAAMLNWTGNWLNGKANTDKFLTVIAWSTIPSICSLILLIPNFLFLGDGKFRLDFNDLLNRNAIIFFAILFINLALSIWSLVILVKGISLIQNFSNGKALLNAVLPALVFLVPIIIILGIIYLVG
jgi:hypothetical protein